MIRDERRKTLFELNQKLVEFLNTIIGNGNDKLMSQRTLAKLLNCSNSTVARWLKGINPISIDMVIKICNILNIDINKLVDSYDFMLYSKIASLTKENQMKVMEYIDFLLYKNNNVIDNKKLTRKK